MSATLYHSPPLQKLSDVPSDDLLIHQADNQKIFRQSSSLLDRLSGRIMAHQAIKRTEHELAKRRLFAVRYELKKVGFSNIDLYKPETRQLARALVNDEHLKAGVNGQADDGAGLFLIATNKRILYIRFLPLFSSVDEVAYELVVGISSQAAGHHLTKLTLHTRSGNYAVEYPNTKAGRTFTRFIESICIVHEKQRMNSTAFSRSK